MKRQKVKGTGHKQPADANTEPNFYSMPPVSVAPPPPHPPRADNRKEPPQASQQQQQQPPPPPPEQEKEEEEPKQPQKQRPPKEAPAQPALSPGIHSIHGAAHLLRGIATGQPYRGVILPPVPFVGLPPAAAPSGSADSKKKNGKGGSRSTSYQSKRTSQSPHRGASFLPRRDEDDEDSS